MMQIRRPKPGRRRPLASRSGGPKTVQYYHAPAPATASGGREGRQSRQPQNHGPSPLTVHLHRLPVYLSILAIAASVWYCSILGNKVTVVLSGSPLYAKDHYEALAGEALNSSVFNHSKFTLNIRALKAQIQAKLPEVSDVSVNIPFVGRKPVVGLTLVAPKYVLTLPDKNAYVIGTNGVVLARTSNVPAASYQSLLTIQEDIPQQINDGQKILSEGDMDFLRTVVGELRAKNTVVSLLELPVGANELFVHLKDTPYIIKFAFNGDPRQQVGDFLSVRNLLGNSPPENYIDVRVGERVYVK